MKIQDKQPLAAVVGPTGTGKTSLGIRLAQRFSGEIISCDSMQVYEGLSIGTAKPSPAELRAVPHHLIGLIPWSTSFSVADYAELARDQIARVHESGKLPILVGGTGLYARSLLYGAAYRQLPRDEPLRQSLQAEAETAAGQAALYARLQTLDPDAAASIHPHNVKRVLRALEVCLSTGDRFSRQQAWQAEPVYRHLLLCLSCRDRALLYDRINRRVDRMLEDGLVEEAAQFHQAVAGEKPLPTVAQAIGYKELFPYFEGALSFAQAVENIKRETRRYAKRQLTWFRRDVDAKVLYLDDYEGADALFEAASALLTDSRILCGEGELS